VVGLEPLDRKREGPLRLAEGLEAAELVELPGEAGDAEAGAVIQRCVLKALSPGDLHHLDGGLG
jgi:hypothetical protein